MSEKKEDLSLCVMSKSFVHNFLTEAEEGKRRESNRSGKG
jgi:hypothetical protein